MPSTHPADSLVAPPWWRPLGRDDRGALFFLVGLALVVFIVPALVGHPAIDADNLIQNFPLRVLAGQQIRSGHLPLLNPLTDAGTPLLGGLNAGAMYPLTFLFVFLPAIMAWLINLMVVYVAAAVGTFALARWHGLTTMPALAAALCYAYSGAMVGQIVHLGVVQGYSFVPWGALLLLAWSRRLRALDPRASWRTYLRVSTPWMLGTACLWGLTFLTGEPRAIAGMELLFLVVVPAVLLFRSSYWLVTWRTRVVYVLTIVVGFALGVGLGLIQLLPGESFIHFSQRSEISYSFFGAGSLAVRWTTLLFTPDLFGGNGAFSQPGYFANYNLAEVTGYVGVLALMGAFAFFARCTRRGWRGSDRDYTLYVALIVVGLFATWGTFTPLGHLFRLIPLFGSTRLQSRNVIFVDFALALLMGWWLEQVRARRVEAGLGRGVRWVVALPALVVVALSVALLGWGPWMLRHISLSTPNAPLATGLGLSNSLHLVIALVAATLVVVLSTWRHLGRALAVVLVADLVVFLLFTSTGLIGGPGPREPSRAQAAAVLGTAGRFALVDLGGSHTGEFRALGEPNMNVFTGLPSVQGYGSLISTVYDNATGTHPQALVNPCHLSTGVFRQLRLSSLAVVAEQLSTKVSGVPAPPSVCVSNPASTTPRRYFGQLLQVGGVFVRGLSHVHDGRGLALNKTSLRLRLLNARGVPVGPSIAPIADIKGRVLFESGYDRPTAGFEIVAPTRIKLNDAVVTTAHGSENYQLDTAFQLALDGPSWRLHDTTDGFADFRATTLRPPAWILNKRDGTVTSIRTASWGDTWVSVHLHQPGELVRSEAYLPGWRATALNNVTGATVQLPVYRHGLVQRVRVPEGSWTVHFHYHAPYIEVGVVGSLVSLVLLVAVSIGTYRVRRRAHGKVHS